MAAGGEVEFKFLFGERDLAKINGLISGVSAVRPPLHQRHRAVYFDTPNSDLWKHGFSLRVEASGKSYVQTVKRHSSSGVDREEWENATDALAPDFDLIKKTPLARLAAKPSIRAALRPAFEVNVERTSHWLEAGGGVIEASIDRGAIEAAGEKLGVREFELELRSGPRPALFNLARAFVSQAPLHPSSISKAERGHLLAEGAFGQAAKGSKPRLGKDMTCEQAFQEICRTCLHDFELNRPGFEKLDNVEAVHQARVAIRRLRAALALFKPMVFDIAYGNIRAELKWLARLLGAARDLDVLQERLQQIAGGQTARVKDLVGRCQAERLHARQAAVGALNSERGRILLLELGVWLDDGRWLRQPSSILREPLQGFVSLALKKRHKKLVKQGADLAHLAPGPRHQLRITAKELRYMAEPFVDVPGIAQERKRLKKLIDCCEKLQTALGTIRDEEALAEFLESGVWGDGAPIDYGAKSTDQRPPQSKKGIEKELNKAMRAYSNLAAIDLF